VDSIATCLAAVGGTPWHGNSKGCRGQRAVGASNGPRSTSSKQNKKAMHGGRRGRRGKGNQISII